MFFLTLKGFADLLHSLSFRLVFFNRSFAVVSIPVKEDFEFASSSSTPQYTILYEAS